MYPKWRKIPMDVSVWMEQDVRIRRATASSGLMPDTPRLNVFLSRQFFSDMFSLSTERHRKMVRYDYNKRMFLKKQKNKAERTMPGLLPYIKPHTKDMNVDTFSRIKTKKDDPLLNSSDQPLSIDSTVKSESLPSSDRSFKIKRRPNRQEMSLENINRLAQPKGRRLDTKINDPIPPNVLGSLTVQDLFGKTADDTYNHSSLSSSESEPSINDKRFRQLIHVFSDVHQSKSFNTKSVKNIIQSNESLQNTSQQWEIQSTIEEEEEEYDQQLLSDTSYDKTDVYLIDSCA